MLNRNIYCHSVKRLLLLLAFFFAVVQQVSAQPDSANRKSVLLTRFPFTVLTGGVVIMQARLDDFSDTLNFILDTGSGGISLDSELVERLHLPTQASEKFLRGIASVKKAVFVKDRTLHIPGLDVEHLDFHINDYAILTSVYGLTIDGIIGYSFFSRYIVKIDYDRNELEVWTKGKMKYPRSGMLLKPVINGIPIFEASIKDNRPCSGRFYFDSGAGLCLLMSDPFERDSSILRKDKKVFVTQAEGLGGKKKMRLSTVKELKFGRYKFRKVPAHVFDDEFNVTAYPTLGGLIGNDLLRRFNLILNYGAGEIHIKPNSHYSDMFDYSYTGLGIYLTGDKVVIEDVLEGSPGEKAGLKPGDVLIAIDNNLFGNIQSFKNQLQAVNSKLKIMVLRDGAPMVFTMEVKSIL